MSPDASPADSTRRDERPQDPLGYERRFWGRGHSWVAGVDEAGRGPLAGPVVAAVVVLSPDVEVDGATDSKKLSPSRREELASRILEVALAVRIGAASVREIDDMNILRATARAMDRAVRGLPRPPEQVVVDGLPVKGVEWTHEAVVGGDALVHSIACASIVAKVCRDRLMRRLAERYPAYGWRTNVGYGTPAHLRALRELGPSPHHRLSFRPNQLSLELELDS